jgi:hypothetical protein
MSMSELDVKRLLMQYEQMVRDINRETINPEIPELQLEDLRPVAHMIAKARAKYLKELFNLAKIAEAHALQAEQIKRLATLRRYYEELVSGSKALEVAIERGYLDIDPQ